MKPTKEACPTCGKPVIVTAGEVGFHWAPDDSVCPASSLPIKEAARMQAADGRVH